MASGTIITQSRTSEAYLPVEGVNVAFFTPIRDGKRELLALRRSDLSGKTAPVTFETPDRSESQQPEAEGASAPYRVVDIVADHPRFERITVEQVQVFPDVTTEQDLMLIPLRSRDGGIPPEERFDTSTQDL